MYDNIGDIMLTAFISWCVLIWIVYKLYFVFGLGIVFLSVGALSIFASFIIGNFAVFLFGLVFIGLTLCYFGRMASTEEIENYNKREEEIANEYGIIDYSDKEDENK